MAETYKCAHCGSNTIQARCWDYQCLTCGNRTDMQRSTLPKEPVFEADNPHNRRPV